MKPSKGKPKAKLDAGNIQKLKRVIQADKKLQDRLGRLKTGEDAYQALSKLGKENGLPFTREEFQQFVAHPDRETGDLTPNEIKSIAGGFKIRPPKTAYVPFGNTLIQTLRWFEVPLQK